MFERGEIWIVSSQQEFCKSGVSIGCTEHRGHYVAGICYKLLLSVFCNGEERNNFHNW